MKNILASVFSLLTLMVLMACAGDPPAPETEPVAVEEPAPEVKPVVEQPTGPSEDELRAQELERQRKELEEMINRIASEEVYFEYDKAILTVKARDLLSQVGDILLKQTRFEILVEGHTDERGTEAYNMTLGSKRAQIVREYLVNYGIAVTRIRTVSFGEEKPKATGESEEAYSQNRRARFQVNVKD